MDSLEELLGPASPGWAGGEDDGEEGEAGDKAGEPAAGEESPLQAVKDERQRLRRERRVRRASVAEVIPGFALMMQAREETRETQASSRSTGAPAGPPPPLPRLSPSDAEAQSGAAAVVKKVVRSIEKRMAADLRGFMVGNLVPDRALRSSERALELILEKAWKKIEVEELVKRKEQKLEDGQPPEAADEDERWARELLQSRDWQANLRLELGLGGGASPAGQQREALDELVGMKNLPEAQPEGRRLLKPIDLAPPDARDEFALAHHLGRLAADGKAGRAAPAVGDAREVPAGRAGGWGSEPTGGSDLGFQPLFTHHAANLSAVKRK